jgi:uncharacterized protein (DUF433 family)
MHLTDNDFPQITYRRGASGVPVAVLRGTGIRVQTIAVAAETWQWTPEEISHESDLTLPQVKEALAFYKAHRREVETYIEAEANLAVDDSG